MLKMFTKTALYGRLPEFKQFLHGDRLGKGCSLLSSLWCRPICLLSLMEFADVSLIQQLNSRFVGLIRVSPSRSYLFAIMRWSLALLGEVRFSNTLILRSGHG